jgi:hypothetical protein
MPGVVVVYRLIQSRWRVDNAAGVIAFSDTTTESGTKPA